MNRCLLRASAVAALRDQVWVSVASAHFDQLKTFSVGVGSVGFR